MLLEAIGSGTIHQQMIGPMTCQAFEASNVLRPCSATSLAAWFGSMLR